MKRKIYYALRYVIKFLMILNLLKMLNKLVRSLSSFSHRLQFIVEWGILENPEYFDHYIDQYYAWYKSRNFLMWERGVFSSIAISPEARVLELCCGDGFNSYHFYSIKSSHVTAIDFDKNAINFAKSNFKTSNLNYILGDIRTDIPKEKFNNIIWDAAIEHFTEAEIFTIMKNIKEALVINGTLSGYTIVERDDGKKHIHQHEYEFKSKDDLARFLSPYFKNVQVFETIFPNRHNLYFYASDGNLPFEKDWNLIINQKKSLFEIKNVEKNSIINEKNDATISL